jgi:hypothetical protein
VGEALSDIGPDGRVEFEDCGGCSRQLIKASALRSFIGARTYANLAPARSLEGL